MRRRGQSSTEIALIAVGVVVVVLLCGAGAWAWPQYNIYRQQAAGEAALREAEFTRQIAELDSRAAVAKAQGDALAEVERAKGAAEANRILADSLVGQDEYIQYLYIQMLRDSNSAGREIIYIPTEGGLPILESTRGSAPPAPATP
jgi:hypothetical protein